MTHPEQQRRAYLEAMGIDVWVPRDAAEDVAEFLQAYRENGNVRIDEQTQLASA